VCAQLPAGRNCIIFQMTAPRTRLPSLSFPDETDSHSVAQPPKRGVGLQAPSVTKSRLVASFPSEPQSLNHDVEECFTLTICGNWNAAGAESMSAPRYPHSTQGFHRIYAGRPPRREKGRDQVADHQRLWRQPIAHGSNAVTPYRKPMDRTRLRHTEIRAAQFLHT
jgi:hypothetical protein